MPTGRHLGSSRIQAGGGGMEYDQVAGIWGISCDCAMYSALPDARAQRYPERKGDTRSALLWPKQK